MIRVIFAVIALLLFVASGQKLVTGQVGGELFMIEAARPLGLVVAISSFAAAVTALCGCYMTAGIVIDRNMGPILGGGGTRYQLSPREF